MYYRHISDRSGILLTPRADLLWQISSGAIVWHWSFRCGPWVRVRAGIA